MSQIENTLYQKWIKAQADFFPAADRKFCKFTEKQQQLIEVLEIAKVEKHIAYVGASQVGRPLVSRNAIARAFVELKGVRVIDFLCLLCIFRTFCHHISKLLLT